MACDVRFCMGVDVVEFGFSRNEDKQLRDSGPADNRYLPEFNSNPRHLLWHRLRTGLVVPHENQASETSINKTSRDAALTL